MQQSKADLQSVSTVAIWVLANAARSIVDTTARVACGIIRVVTSDVLLTPGIRIVVFTTTTSSTTMRLQLTGSLTL